MDQRRQSQHVTHRYVARSAWRGSTGVGYEGYERAHTVIAPPCETPLLLSGDAAFLGDPRRMNPESLLLAAASSCQLLSFLAVAARARIDVVAYEDDAEAVMSEAERPVRISEITLRTRITVRPPVTEARVRRLIDVAHRECYIANTVTSDIRIVPEVVIVGDRPRCG